MIKIIYFISALLTGSLVNAGSSSVGGASVVISVSKSGECKATLVDYAAAELKNNRPYSQEQLDKCYYDKYKNLEGKNAYLQAGDFFDDALDIFKKQKKYSKNYKKIIDGTQVFIELNPFEYTAKRINILNPIFIYSNSRSSEKVFLSDSFPENIQSPLVYFIPSSFSLVGISSPIFTTLSAEEKIGAKLHEAFRHMNSLEILESPLTTEEIEIAVRHFTNKSFINDNFTPVNNKLTKLNKSFIEEQFQVKMGNNSQKELDMDELAKSSIVTTKEFSGFIKQTLDTYGEL